MRDGKLIAAAEEERFSRRKHDFDWPGNAIAYCLREAGLGIEQVDHVVFYEKPLVKFVGYPLAMGACVGICLWVLLVPLRIDRFANGPDEFAAAMPPRRDSPRRAQPGRERRRLCSRRKFGCC